MNSRATITLVLFLGWATASTWWYTCKIKGVCINSESAGALTIPETESTASTPTVEDTVKTDVVVTTLEKVTILFSFGSVEQEKNADIDNYITQLAAQLKSGSKQIEVVGHTDNTGDENSNEQLGMQRAESVKTTLVQLGVDPAQINCTSKGETQPVASNDTEEGKRQNRRVEIHFN